MYKFEKNFTDPNDVTILSCIEMVKNVIGPTAFLVKQKMKIRKLRSPF